MLNWYDLEERAGVVREEISVAGETASLLAGAGMENDDTEQTTIRRKLADVFINLGARIDREALGARAA